HCSTLLQRAPPLTTSTLTLHDALPIFLGTPDSIRALTRDQMHGYFERRYVAPNITVVAAGNFEFPHLVEQVEKQCAGWNTGPVGDRKSTRLNSSHLVISYAVFCLKKKK